MEFTIDREVFLRGIQKTLGIVEKASSMPLMRNVLIIAGDAGLKIVATDLEIGLVSEYEAGVIQEGELTLPARKLYETVRELQGETLHMVTADGAVSILTSNRTVCRLHGMSADDYPAVQVPDDFPFFNIKGVLLEDMIRKVSFAISTDEMKRNLAGVFLEKDISGETALIRMVATDGHRLAVVKADTKVKDNPLPEKGVIIPRKGLAEIRKMAENEDDEISMGFQLGACIVKSGHTLLRISLIDGEYPDYRRVVMEADADDLRVRMEKDALLHSLRRMNVIFPECTTLKISDKTIALNATNPDVGEINDEIEANCRDREESLRVNVKYLFDAVEVVSGKMVELEIQEEGKRILVRDADDENYFCIVMPLKN